MVVFVSNSNVGHGTLLVCHFSSSTPLAILANNVLTANVCQIADDVKRSVPLSLTGYQLHDDQLAGFENLAVADGDLGLVVRDFLAVE